MLTQGMVRGDLLPLVRMRSKGLSNQVVSVHGQNFFETSEIRSYLLRKGYYNNV